MIRNHGFFLKSPKITKSIISAQDGDMDNDKILKAIIFDVYIDDMNNKEILCLADYFSSIVYNKSF